MQPWVELERAQRNPQLVTLDGTWLAELLGSACFAIEKYCRRQFQLTKYALVPSADPDADPPESAAEIRDGDGSTSLFVRNFPVTTLTSVTIKDSQDVEVVYAASEFRIDPRIGEIQWKPNSTGFSGASWFSGNQIDWCAGAYFPVGFQNITIVYTGGFSPIPSDIIEAVVQLAAALAADNTRDAGLASEKLGDYAYTTIQGPAGNETERMTGLPQKVRDLVAPYRVRF